MDTITNPSDVASANKLHSSTAPVELSTLVKFDIGQIDEAASDCSVQQTETLVSPTSTEQTSIAIDDPRTDGSGHGASTSKPVYGRRRSNDHSAAGTSGIFHSAAADRRARMRPERSLALASADPTATTTGHRGGPLKALLGAAHQTIAGRASMPVLSHAANTLSVPRDYHTVLFALVKEGNVRAVTTILNNHILNLNYRDTSDCSFLHYAATNGHAEIVRLLCEHHASVDAPDDEMRSPLIRATLNGRVDCVRALLEHNALVDKHDILGWTALMWASYKGETEIARLLIDRGANVNVKADQHMTSLTWAAGRGHTEVVRLLVERGANVNATDRYGSTALIWAARKGHAGCCEALLNAGANADFVGMHARTPLLVAARFGSVDCVRVLLSKASNINAVDKDGYTALGRAVKAQALEIVELLVAEGAQTDAQDREGESILIHAVKTGSAQLTRLLLPKCNNINYQDSDGKTALFHAVDRNQLEIAAALIDAKANAEIAANASENDDTPLLRAVRNRNVELTEVLIKKAKARITAIDSKGNTCLHIALRNRSRRITELLLRNPKDNYLLYKPNRAGETPYAIDMSQPSSVLTQIFGFRNLNTIESSDFLSGYDLYSSIIADVLTEPGLVTPLTVGLYAKWGSGKSFLLERLEHEMRKFTYSAQLTEQLRDLDAHDVRFEPCYVAYCAAIASVVAYVVGIVLFSLFWSAVSFVVLFVALVSVLGFIVVVARRGHTAAMRFGIRLRSRVLSFNVLLESLFCTPRSPNNAASDDDSSPNGLPSPQKAKPLLVQPSAVRFIFSEKTPLNAVYGSGEQIAAHLLISLYKNVEREVGTFATRLYCGLHARLPANTQRRSRFKAICYVPYWLICTLALIALLADSVFIVALLRQYHLAPVYHASSTLPPGASSGSSISGAPADVNLSSMRINQTVELASELLPNVVVFTSTTSSSISSDSVRPTNAEGAGINESLVAAIACLSTFLGILLVTHSLRLFRILSAFAYPPQRRIQSALDKLSKSSDSMAVGGDFHTLAQRDAADHNNRPSQIAFADGATRLLFLQTMQQEIRRLVQFVQLHDSFSSQTSRFILVVDGLDSVETVKLVSAIDLISALFCESDLAKSSQVAMRNDSRRFVVLLAIDPQLIIAGIDRSIAQTSQSQPSNSNSTVSGFEYLRNLVQLPIYLQSPNLRLLPTGKQAGVSRSRSRRNSKRDSQSSLNQLGRQSSLLSVRRPTEVPVIDASVLASSTNAVQNSSHGGSQVLFSSHSHIPFVPATKPTRTTSDLNVALVRNDYFSDINPKSMRRLLNITAVIGRILRAYNIEFSWPKLAVWTNITEQWPCRSAWMVWYFEQHSDTLEDTLTLRAVYERMSVLLPAASVCDQRLQRLFEVDRNPAKLERLVNNEQLARITVHDLRRFVPFGINLDPFMRKVIREHMTSPPAAPSPPVALSVAVPTMPMPVNLPPLSAARLRRRCPLDAIAKTLPPDDSMRLLSVSSAALNNWRSLDLAAFIHVLCKPAASIEQVGEVLAQNDVDGAVVSLMTDLNDLNQLLKLPFAKWQRVKAGLCAVQERDSANWDQFDSDAMLGEAVRPSALITADAAAELMTPLPSTTKQMQPGRCPSPNIQQSTTPVRESQSRTVSFRGLRISTDMSTPQLQSAQRSPATARRMSDAPQKGLSDSVTTSSVNVVASASVGHLELHDDNLHELLAIQEALDSRMADSSCQESASATNAGGRSHLVSLVETVRDDEAAADFAQPTRSPADSGAEGSGASSEQDEAGKDAGSKRRRKRNSKKQRKSGETTTPQKERSHTSIFRKSLKTPEHVVVNFSASQAATSGGSDATPLLSGSEKVGKFVVMRVDSNNSQS